MYIKNYNDWDKLVSTSKQLVSLLNKIVRRKISFYNSSKVLCLAFVTKLLSRILYSTKFQLGCKRLYVSNREIKLSTRTNFAPLPARWRYRNLLPQNGCPSLFENSVRFSTQKYVRGTLRQSSFIGCLHRTMWAGNPISEQWKELRMPACNIAALCSWLSLWCLLFVLVLHSCTLWLYSRRSVVLTFYLICFRSEEWAYTEIR